MRREWRHVLGLCGAFLLGLSFVCVEPLARRRPGGGPTAAAGSAGTAVSSAGPLTRDALVERVTPKVLAELRSRKDEVVAKAGGPVDRAVVRALWPALEREVPVAVEAIVEHIRNDLGHYSVSDLLKFLETH